MADDADNSSADRARKRHAAGPAPDPALSRRSERISRRRERSPNEPAADEPAAATNTPGHRQCLRAILFAGTSIPLFGDTPRPQPVMARAPASAAPTGRRRLRR